MYASSYVCMYVTDKNRENKQSDTARKCQCNGKCYQVQYCITLLQSFIARRSEDYVVKFYPERWVFWIIISYIFIVDGRRPSYHEVSDLDLS